MLRLGLVEQQLAGRRTASEPVSALYLIMLLIYRVSMQKDYSIKKNNNPFAHFYFFSLKLNFQTG